MMIKTVIRQNLPETNSSSSHSLVINMGPERYKNMKGRTLKIDYEQFGSDPNIINDLVSKIQYAVGVIPFGINHDYLYVPEYLQHVKKLKDIVIKEYSGELIFDYLIQYFQDLINNEEDVCLIDSIPTVDHQSMELYDEIWENDNTLRDFLINPKSELYIDSDAYEVVDLLHNSNISDFDITLIYPIGGEIGDVEIPVLSANLKESNTSILLREAMNNIFNSIIFTKEGIAKPKYDYLMIKDRYEFNTIYGGKDYWVARWGKFIEIYPSMVSKEFGVL